MIPAAIQENRAATGWFRRHPKIALVLAILLYFVSLYMWRHIHDQAGIRIYPFDVPAGTEVNGVALARHLAQHMELLAHPYGPQFKGNLSSPTQPATTSVELPQQSSEANDKSFRAGDIRLWTVQEQPIFLQIPKPDISLEHQFLVASLAYRGISLDAVRRFHTDFGKRIHKISGEVWREDNKLLVIVYTDGEASWVTSVKDASRTSFDSALADLAPQLFRELEPKLAIQYARYLAQVASDSIEAQNLDRAIQLLHRALDLDPHFPEALGNLGVALQKKGRLEEAIATYEKVLKRKPDFPPILNNLGTALREKGRLEEAIATYQKALQLEPNSSAALNNLGLALYEKGQFDDAIASFQKAFQLEPREAMILSNLGAALAQKGRFDEAIPHLQNSLTLEPKWPETLLSLGNVFAEKDAFNSAIAYLQKAVELAPNMPEAHYFLGRVLRRSGRLDEAVASHQKALHIRPNYADAHFDLALALRRKGELKAAQREFAEAQRLDPNLIPPLR